MEKKNKTFYSIYGIAFFVLILAVLAVHLVLPDLPYSVSEKRNLQTVPAVSVSSLLSGDFMTDAESYTSDQFPFRDLMMRIRMNAMRYLGLRESNGVFYAKDGSLIETYEGYDEALMKTTVEALNAFEARYDFEHFYVLVVPTAVSVYPEKLPDHADVSNEEAYIEAFQALLSPSAERLEYRSVFEAMKENRVPIYYLTDHHWETDAAFRVFKANAPAAGWKVGRYAAGTVTNTFSGSLVSKSGFTPAALDDITVYLDAAEGSTVLVTHEDGSLEPGSSFYNFDALNSDNPYEVFLGGNEPEIIISTTADTDRTLLVLKDSYANCFLPFLADSYKTITVVDPRYITESIDTLMMTASFMDVLVLYNANTLSADENLRMVLEP